MNLSVWSLKTVTYTDEFRKTDITLCSLGNIPTLPPCLVSVERERETKKQGGRVGMQPRQWWGTESVGLRMCRPYARTGAGRLNDDILCTPKKYQLPSTKSHSESENVWYNFIGVQTYNKWNIECPLRDTCTTFLFSC